MNQVISSLLLITSITLQLVQAKQYPTITTADVENLRTDIRNAIDASSFDSRNGLIENGIQPLIGSVVRLIFHDCAGRNIKQNNGNGADSPSGQLIDNVCNGCFDFDSADNGGLEEFAFNTLEDIYQGFSVDTVWADKMSRADFWAAAATIAVEKGGENNYILFQNEFINPPLDVWNRPQSLRDIPYYFGRKDCPRSPYATEEAGGFLFPSALDGWQATFAWFSENMGLTARETVVLLGAHTVGTVRPESSGFVHFWSVDPHVLDNQFFSFMTVNSNFFDGIAFNAFEQRRVGNTVGCKTIFSDTCEEPGFNGDLRQWVVGNATLAQPQIVGTGILLNSDISLALKIEDHLDPVTGEVTCDAPTLTRPPTGNECPPQPVIHEIVNELGFDNSIFIPEFIDVFEKMILLGQKNGGKKLDKLIVPYDRSFEDEPFFNDLISGGGSAALQGDDGLDTNIKQIEDNDNGIIGSDYMWVIIGASVGCFCLIILGGVIYRYKKKAMMEEQVKEITAVIENK